MAKCISCPITSEYQDKPFTCYSCKRSGQTTPETPTSQKQSSTLKYSKTEFEMAVDFIEANHWLGWPRSHVVSLIKGLISSLTKDPTIEMASTGGVTVIRDECDNVSILVNPAIGADMDEFQ